MSRNLSVFLRAGAVAAGLALVSAAPATAAWQSLGELDISGDHGLPVDPKRPGAALPNVGAPDLEVIDGKLHAAWTEWDGNALPGSPYPPSPTQVRVARLDEDGWHELGCGPSPVNHTPSRPVADVDLSQRQGEPLLAWVESDADWRGQARVAQYDTSTGQWNELGGGAQPLNNNPVPHPQDARRFSAANPRLAVIGDRPYVLFQENDFVEYDVKLARLSADGASWLHDLPAVLGGNRSPAMTAAGNELWTWMGARNGGGVLASLVPGASAFTPRWTGRAEDATGLTALDSEGSTPYFVGRFADELRVQRFNAVTGEFELLAPGLGPVVGEELDVAGGRPFVAGFIGVGTDRVLTVQALEPDGSRFANVRTVVNGEPAPGKTGADRLHSVALATLDGRPYVAWVEWNGTRWTVRVAGDVPSPRAVPTVTAAPACPTTPPPGDGDGEKPEPPKVDGGEQTPQGGGETTPPPAAAPTPTPTSTSVTAASQSRPIVRAAGPPFRLLTKSLKPAKGGKSVRLRIRCLRAGGCDGTLVLRTAKGQKLSIARGSARIARGKSGTVTLKLTGEGRRLLRRGGTSFRLVLIVKGA